MGSHSHLAFAGHAPCPSHAHTRIACELGLMTTYGNLHGTCHAPSVELRPPLPRCYTCRCREFPRSPSNPTPTMASLGVGSPNGALPSLASLNIGSPTRPSHMAAAAPATATAEVPADRPGGC